MTEPAVPPPPPPPSAAPSAPPSAKPERSGARLWTGRAAALAVVVLFGWGTILMAGWLRERGDLARPIPSPVSPQKSVRDAVIREPLLDPWLDPAVSWGPVRRTSFGRDPALLVTGPSADGPDLVFERRLLAFARSLPIDGLAQAIREGPSATRAFRLNATLSAGPICASLVRLPPDVLASRGGTLRTEPGLVMLAFHAPKRSLHPWDYVTFFFPKGLDLSALARESAPPPRVLAVLGAEAQRFLVPTLALGADAHTQGSRTVLCRSVGTAGYAIDRVADALQSDGWRPLEGDPASRPPGTRVLTGPKGTVWMATTDVDRPDGLVSILVEAP